LITPDPGLSHRQNLPLYTLPVKEQKSDLKNEDINNQIPTVIKISTIINTDTGNSIDETFNKIVLLDQLSSLFGNDDINNRTSTVINDL
ncbi:87_t:CDS:2, partial [Ambispora leptoticha]